MPYERNNGDLTAKKDKNDKHPGPNQKLGERGEMAASKYLEKLGYTVLDRNFRCRAGEIDIIAAEGDDDASEGFSGGQPVLVFVEVKTRVSLKYGAPSLAVTAAKQRHLITAAALYSSIHGLGGITQRYDVIEILWIDGNVYLRHTRNAFS